MYAQGGPGNPRLIAWEGERTLTFTMEDALLSAESFAILSGAGLIAATEDEPIYVHATAQVEAIAANTFKVEDLVCWNGGRTGKVNTVPEKYAHKEADIFCMKLDDNGEIAAEPCVPAKVEHQADGSTIITCFAGAGVEKDDIVLVDYYVKKTGKAQMIEITADKFGGNYYLEASTLFRRESDGVDMPAEFVIPNCKVQSNFTFSMASSGDPSTFTFTIDAFPDYTKFDRTHKVLAAIQVIEDEDGEDVEEWRDNCDSEAKNDPTPNAVEGVSKHADANGVSLARAGNTIYVYGTANGKEFDRDTFDANGLKKVKGVEIKLDAPEFVGDVTVVQENPGLAYYSGDEDITLEGNTWTKEKDYSAVPENEAYQFLVTDKEGPISIEFKNGSKSLKKYIVNNNVSFTK